MRKLLFGLCVAMTGCSSGHEQITGNAQGGVMPFHRTDERKAFNAAQAHCAKHGKDARITQIIPYAGGTVSFDCVKV